MDEKRAIEEVATTSSTIALSNYGEVFASENAHVIHDECGAVELQTAGARITRLPAQQGILDAGTLSQWLDDHPASVHSQQPAAVTITQASECGTLYTPQQVAAIGEVCRQRGLALHMDGARFANAVVALQVPPAALTWEAGVDVLSFGATKNGALGAEALIAVAEATARQARVEAHRPVGGRAVRRRAP